MKLTKQEINDLKQIEILLTEAKKYDLEWEVINSAIKYYKINKQKSLLNAFKSGFAEWIK